MCSQSFPNFILWTPAFSGIFAHSSKTVRENVSAPIWVLLILHFLHKEGKIKAVFSAVVLLHLLRFGELWRLSVGFMAAQKYPFPVQSSGSTQPDVSPPKPLLPRGCVILPSCLDSLQTMAPQPHRTKNPFTEGMGDGSFEVNPPRAAGSCPPSHMSHHATPPAHGTAGNRRSQPKPGLGELAEGWDECWNKVSEGGGRESWFVLPLRVWGTWVQWVTPGLTFVLGEPCFIQDSAPLAPAYLYSWNMGLGKSEPWVHKYRVTVWRGKEGENQQRALIYCMSSVRDTPRPSNT